MAVKGKKCQDIKSTDWISLSFMDSFGSSPDEKDEPNSPSEKRLKLDNDFDDFDIDVDDLISIENQFKSDANGSKCNKINEVNTVTVWCEKYKPTTIENLVVNKKKISEVETWLMNVFFNDNNRSRNQMLLLTGPTGCGKTCTLNILCNSLNVNIIEWTTPMDLNTYDNFNEKNFSFHQQPITQLFDEFIISSSKYNSLISLGNGESNRKIILVKDFPNIFLNKPEGFHKILDKYYNSSSNCNISPLVFIITCQNLVRELFPDDIKFKYNITTLNFNPVTETNILKALNRILQYESAKLSKIPNKEELVNICDSSAGDLRSAILKLQFNLENLNPKDVFKMPTMISKGRGRIKIKKSSTKQKICEIDKDKKIDFFNSIGRVLYPKKETSGESKNIKFVHSPDSIVDDFLVEPNKLVNMLHENYLDRFTKIKDVSTAAISLSTSDYIMSSNWENKDTMIRYGLANLVRSLMISNTCPAPTFWKPLSKSKIWSAENNRKENLIAVDRIFPNVQSNKDILLDVIPLLKKLNVKLTAEQDEIISKIASYKR